MQTRELGKDKLKVSAIGLGGRRLSDAYTETRGDTSKAQALIDHAIERGLTHIDTSDSYDATRNESLFGEILAGKRDKVVLATKFGFVTRDDGSRGICGHPDYVPKACEASLKRLNTDVIDLYYLHRVDPEVPIEDTVGAMARLKEAGKIRHIGLSEAGPETLRRATNLADDEIHISTVILIHRRIEGDPDHIGIAYRGQFAAEGQRPARQTTVDQIFEPRFEQRWFSPGES
jgi:aryl-alcohol dehydrogenase-like predicted oxidoreductase